MVTEVTAKKNVFTYTYIFICTSLTEMSTLLYDLKKIARDIRHSLLLLLFSVTI